MNIIEFFDTENETHVNAFMHLNEKGAWPEDFYNTLVDNNITIPTLWQVSLMGKIATIYMTKQKEKFEKK